MDIEGIKKAKYKFNKHNNVIEKDGHTMFLEDVEKDLNRKSYLEEENKELKAENENNEKTLTTWIRMEQKLQNENTKLKERVKEFESITKELVVLMDDVYNGDYKPDSFTTQPAKQLLNKN